MRAFGCGIMRWPEMTDISLLLASPLIGIEERGVGTMLLSLGRVRDAAVLNAHLFHLA